MADHDAGEVLLGFEYPVLKINLNELPHGFQRQTELTIQIPMKIIVRSKAPHPSREQRASLKRLQDEGEEAIKPPVKLQRSSLTEMGQLRHPEVVSSSPDDEPGQPPRVEPKPGQSSTVQRKPDPALTTQWPAAAPTVPGSHVRPADAPGSAADGLADLSMDNDGAKAKEGATAAAMGPHRDQDEAAPALFAKDYGVDMERPRLSAVMDTQ
eukprot:9504113-Pyramimonas_sp.AAC.1